MLRMSADSTGRRTAAGGFELAAKHLDLFLVPVTRERKKYSY
jgi:hypothetical protein